MDEYTLIGNYFLIFVSLNFTLSLNITILFHIIFLTREKLTKLTLAMQYFNHKLIYIAGQNNCDDNDLHIIYV